MRAAWIQAQRDTEVREAARGWRRAGAIDGDALAAIEAAYPAIWPNPSFVWGILGFVFVTFAAGALFVALEASFRAATPISLFLALLLALAADRLRPSVSGSSAATGGAAAFWSVVCLLVAVADTLAWGDRAVTPLLCVGAAAWAAAAWRWGYPSFAVFSSIFLFLMLARFPQGRALWILCGVSIAALTSPLLDRARLAPSHRRCTAAALAAALAAVYAAINRYCLDRGFVENVAGRHAAGSISPAVQAVSTLATAILPVLVLFWGIRARRALVLDIGVLLAALSLATLRAYVHLAPLDVVLLCAGALLVGLALGVHRWLARAKDRQKGGFTADALFSNERGQQAMGIAATALTLAPDAAQAPSAPTGDFRGGGGASGGGGSSGSF